MRALFLLSLPQAQVWLEVLWLLLRVQSGRLTSAVAAGATRVAARVAARVAPEVALALGILAAVTVECVLVVGWLAPLAGSLALLAVLLHALAVALAWGVLRNMVAVFGARSAPSSASPSTEEEVPDGSTV